MNEGRKKGKKENRQTGVKKKYLDTLTCSNHTVLNAFVRRNVDQNKHRLCLLLCLLNTGYSKWLGDSQRVQYVLWLPLWEKTKLVVEITKNKRCCLKRRNYGKKLSNSSHASHSNSFPFFPSLRPRQCFVTW